jgi:undecaprenyl-diphosphatase
MNVIWDSLINVAPIWLYAAIAALVFLECSAFFGLVFPGETAILLGGFMAYQGKLSVITLAVVTSLAAISGDTVGYWLGDYKGRRWIVRFGKRFGASEERLDSAKQYFHRFGGRAVFLGRFTSVARAFVPFTAGTLHLPYRVFLPYNVAGGIVWATLFSYLGYIFGSQWRHVAKIAGRGGLILLAILILTAYFIYRRRRNKVI